ncbi:taste receptor type 2 member 40-like [Hyla sarda]|uniref:taste receptor type 2 member 40-like n=1 Tax=Hyla sarda TaxID=327740 RepID=UPI0024C44468|nr:taste receptor type 2 member 40-like [Hyla sarda]
MLTPTDVTHVLIIIILLVPGTALNSFIISIYFTHWRKKQQFTACEQIFLSTALTNLLLQWFSLVIELVYFVFIKLKNFGTIYLYISIFLFCMSYFFFWNTAWLSAQYCLKLGNHSSGFLTWLKVKFSSSMTQVIVASLLWVLVTSLPMYWAVSFVKDNVTVSSGVVMNPNSLALNVVLGCVLPFIQTLICIGLSIIYLLRHVRRIRQNEAQYSSSPQVSGHLRAVRTMTVHLLLNAALQAGITGRILSAFNPKSFTSVSRETCGFLIQLYPSAEALTIIMANRTLKKKLLKTLEFLYRKT